MAEFPAVPPHIRKRKKKQRSISEKNITADKITALDLAYSDQELHRINHPTFDLASDILGGGVIRGLTTDYFSTGLTSTGTKVSKKSRPQIIEETSVVESVEEETRPVPVRRPTTISTTTIPSSFDFIDSEPTQVVLRLSGILNFKTQMMAVKIIETASSVILVQNKEKSGGVLQIDIQTKDIKCYLEFSDRSIAVIPPIPSIFNFELGCLIIYIFVKDQDVPVETPQIVEAVQIEEAVPIDVVILTTPEEEEYLDNFL
jgi:hypothetical protein